MLDKSLLGATDHYVKTLSLKLNRSPQRVVKLNFDSQWNQLFAFCACLKYGHIPFLGSDISFCDFVWSETGIKKSKASPILNQARTSIQKARLTFGDELFFLESSGTETSKFVLHSLNNLLSNTTEFSEMESMTILLSHYHAAWIDTVFECIKSNLRFHFEDREVSFRLDENSSSLVCRSTPSFCLIKAAKNELDLNRYQKLILGSEELTQKHIQSFLSINPNLIIEQVYGTTETLGLTTETNSKDSRFIKIPTHQIDFYKDNAGKDKIEIKNNRICILIVQDGKVFWQGKKFKTSDSIRRSQNYISIFRETKNIVNFFGKKVSIALISKAISDKFPTLDFKLEIVDTDLAGQALILIIKSGEDLKSQVKSLCEELGLPILKIVLESD